MAQNKKKYFVLHPAKPRASPGKKLSSSEPQLPTNNYS